MLLQIQPATESWTLPVQFEAADTNARLLALTAQVKELQAQVGALLNDQPLAGSKSWGARKLGIGHTKFWELVNLDDDDPMKIRVTNYGTVPISEIKRHLEVATNPKTKARK